jgi:hypothetical protein
VQRPNAEADYFACSRWEPAQIRLEERLHFCVRLRDAHARLEPRKQAHGIAKSTIDFRLGGWIEGHGLHDVGRFQRGELKIFGEDSDHADKLAIDVDHAAEDGWIAVVVALPQAIGNDRDPRDVGTIFFRREVSAKDRSDPQQGQESRLKRNAPEFRRVVFDQVAIVDAGALARDSSKRLLTIPPLHKGASHEELLVLQRLHQAHGYEPTRIRIRQRPKQYAIHNTEHRGGGSNTERESQQDADGKHRIAVKTTKGVPNILKGCLHPLPLPYVAFVIAYCQEISDHARGSADRKSQLLATGQLTHPQGVKVESRFRSGESPRGVSPDRKMWET